MTGAYRAAAADAHALARREKALARHARVFSWRNVLWAIALALLARLRGHVRAAAPAADISVPDGMRIVRTPAVRREIDCSGCGTVFQYHARQHTTRDLHGIAVVKCPVCGATNANSRSKPVRS